MILIDLPNDLKKGSYAFAASLEPIFDPYRKLTKSDNVSRSIKQEEASENATVVFALRVLHQVRFVSPKTKN